jgi:hypothetical protein
MKNISKASFASFHKEQHFRFFLQKGQQNHTFQQYISPLSYITAPSILAKPLFPFSVSLFSASQPHVQRKPGH